MGYTVGLSAHIDNCSNICYNSIMGEYEFRQPPTWADEPERPEDTGQLQPETYHSITTAIDDLLRLDDAEELSFEEAAPFSETVLQEETDEGQIGDAITSEMSVGQRWKHVDEDLKEEIEVVRLNPFAVGVATAETGQYNPISRKGYIRFIKKSEAEDVLCAGILWLLDNANISAQGEMVIPTDTTKGHQGLQFASKLGLSALWRSGLSVYDPDQPVMNTVTFDQLMDDEMGKELSQGLRGLIDQPGQEQ